MACQSLGPLEKGGSVLGVDVKVKGSVHFMCKKERKGIQVLYIFTECVDMFFLAEQKVKVPSDHCDQRVQTLCGDVLTIDPNILLPYACLVNNHFDRVSKLLDIAFLFSLQRTFYLKI